MTKPSIQTSCTQCQKITSCEHAIKPNSIQSPKSHSPLLVYRKEDDPWVDISNRRIPNSKLGSLYSGSRFKGKQKCGDSEYEVLVDLKQVNIKESLLCGYLYIKGLTAEQSELTTYFEGEIIGPKYSFLTRKWHAVQDIDRQHWELFEPFKPLAEVFNKEDFVYDPIDSDVVYMRWKERFLVPNHHIENVIGASFAGFYYIAYQRSTDKITGFYFYHLNTDRFQALTLENVNQHYLGSFEFR
ncbi:vacuolar import and degradation protein-domain-containing protein [Phycomyces nitens]|nr:vacuolar import and degradation protein-domain-containing protein [Phycomyces nitens]